MAVRSVVDDSGEALCFYICLTDRPIRLKECEVIGVISKIESTHSMDEPSIDNTCAPDIVPDYLREMYENMSAELSESERKQVRDLVIEFKNIFLKPGGKLGVTDLISHTIETENATPIKLTPRRVPLAQQEIIENEVEKMLKDGIVEPSDSPWSAPIV